MRVVRPFALLALTSARPPVVVPGFPGHPRPPPLEPLLLARRRRAMSGRARLGPLRVRALAAVARARAGPLGRVGAALFRLALSLLGLRHIALVRLP